MPGPRISERYKYMTVPQAAKRLGIHPAKYCRCVRNSIVPPPTNINEHSLRFFDEAWLKNTKTIIENSSENQVRQQTEGWKMASTQKVFSASEVKHGLSPCGSGELEAVESLLVEKDSELFVQCQVKDRLVQGQIFVFQHSLDHKNDR